MNIASQSYIPLSINNNELMRIDASGNVGIGKTSPLYRLDVSGTINYNGAIYYNALKLKIPIEYVSWTTYPTMVNFNGYTANSFEWLNSSIESSFDLVNYEYLLRFSYTIASGFSTTTNNIHISFNGTIDSTSYQVVNAAFYHNTANAGSSTSGVYSNMPDNTSRLLYIPSRCQSDGTIRVRKHQINMAGSTSSHIIAEASYCNHYPVSSGTATYSMEGSNTRLEYLIDPASSFSLTSIKLWTNGNNLFAPSSGIATGCVYSITKIPL